MTVARVDQVVAEVLRTNDAPVARVDQVAAEVLRTSLQLNVQLSQLVVEVLRPNDPDFVTVGVTPALAFGAGLLYARSPDGTVRQIGALQGVTVDLAFGPRYLHGGPWPIAIGRGAGHVTCHAQMAQLSADALTALYFGGTAADGMTRVATDEAVTVAGGAATAAHAATYTGDLGVTTADGQGLILTRVAAAPVGLQYACDDAGGYTLPAALEGATLLISYTYADPTAGRTITVGGGRPGDTPYFEAWLSTTFGGRELALQLPVCTAGSLRLGAGIDTFMLPDFTFLAAAGADGVIGTLSISGGTTQ